MKINLEYRKGILFFRIIGSLNKRTSYKLEDTINKLVLDNQFTNIVINLDKLKKIDYYGIAILYCINELVIRENGHLLLCLSKNNRIKKIILRENILNKLSNIESELKAFELIKI